MQYVPRSAIIARLGIIGDGMCEKIEVLGLQLDGFTAKEAMQEAIRYMETEPISTIEISPQVSRPFSRGTTPSASGSTMMLNNGK